MLLIRGETWHYQEVDHYSCLIDNILTDNLALSYAVADKLLNATGERLTRATQGYQIRKSLEKNLACLN